MEVSGGVETRRNCRSPHSTSGKYAPEGTEGRELWVLYVRSLAGELRYGVMILSWDTSLMGYSSPWGYYSPHDLLKSEVCTIYGERGYPG